MTKTDFAELKEKLGKFDYYGAKVFSKSSGYNFLPDVQSRYEVGMIEGAQHQHTKSAAIISELIDIIKSQSETIDELNEEATLVHQREIAEKSLSETTTRLQKLREEK